MRATWILLLVSCGGQSSAPSMPMAERDEKSADEGEMGRASGGNAPEAAPPEAPAGAVYAKDAAPPAPAMAMEPKAKKADAPSDADGDAGGGAPVRSWFPESFLWAPLVETDAAGVASVSVRVPDTLTTWRVLALGQSREGAQSGTTATFRSTLPAYVDLTVPAFLYTGDRPSFALQVVNQTSDALRGFLSFSALGGSGAAGGNVEVAPWGSMTRRGDVTVTRAGELVLSAGLGDVDAVSRQIPVRPVGRPVTLRRGGTLASTREIPLLVDPAGRDGQLAVSVFPGALALVQAEVGAAASRTGVWSDAYAFSLVARGAPLVGADGVSADSLRALRLGAWQRLRTASLSPDAPTMVALLTGLAGSDKGSLERQTYDRIAHALADAQQPDGLWGLPGGASIDAVLVQTAMAAWALGPEAKGPRARARGAFERYRDRIAGPSVAAWGLRAGIVDGALADAARKVVSDAIRVAPDGSRYAVGQGVRPDGSRTSDAEMTALAALVIDDEAVRADLVTWLLGAYQPSAGFGDGLADVLALQALSEALGGEIPAQVAIILESGGRELARATLDPSHPRQPVHLAAPPLAPDAVVTLRAEPPVPGLAFALEYTAWVPWVQAAPAGLDVVVTPMGALVAGEESEIEVRVAAPSAGPPGAARGGAGRVEVEVGLPAGVELASPPGALAPGPGAPEDHGDRLVFHDVPVEGGAWSTRVVVRPSLAGVLQTGPQIVTVDGERFTRVPSVWTVR